MYNKFFMFEKCAKFFSTQESGEIFLLVDGIFLLPWSKEWTKEGDGH
jgi:hypothetical protein